MRLSVWEIGLGGNRIVMMCDVLLVVCLIYIWLALLLLLVCLKAAAVRVIEFANIRC